MTNIIQPDTVNNEEDYVLVITFDVDKDPTHRNVYNLKHKYMNSVNEHTKTVLMNMLTHSLSF